MPLTKNFLQFEPKFLELKRGKLIIGLVIGLSYSFTFYSFLYLIREVYRILSVTEIYDLWILTDKEVYFYNLFYAFIAVILAQSVVFQYWFDRPKQFYESKNYRKTSIINDQRALNWYFLNWFSKLSTFFGIMFGLGFNGSFYVFSFYPDFNYLFILIVIVLFLQTWNTIRLVFKRKSFKWMILTIAVVSIIAFGLSRINLIDYKAINDICLRNNIYYKYNLELPETVSGERTHRRYLVEKIYVVESKIKTDNSDPIIIIDNKEIPFEKLKDKTSDLLLLRSNYDIRSTVFQLHIHKAIKMEFVNRLKGELSRSGVSKITYAAIPVNPKYDKRYYQDFSLPGRLPIWFLKDHPLWLDPAELYYSLNEFNNIIEIKHDDSGKFYINDNSVKTGEIKQTIVDLIKEEPGYVIKFQVNDNVDFVDYFNVLSYSSAAINDLRNEYSNEVYSKQFEFLGYEEQIEIRDKIPLRIFELTCEIKKLIGID